MTKAATKRQRRARSRKRQVTMPGGEQIERKAKRGFARQEPADQVALFARLRHAGLSATPEALALARAPWLGCAVGRGIVATSRTEDDRARLWSAVCHIRRTVIAYDRALGSPNRHAQCLRILAPADAMHADAASPAVDTRTPEEKHTQAVTAWMRLHGWLGYADNAARSACLRHVVDEPQEPVCDWPGITAALECVAEGLRGDVPTYRGRRGKDAEKERR